MIFDRFFKKEKISAHAIIYKVFDLCSEKEFFVLKSKSERIHFEAVFNDFEKTKETIEKWNLAHKKENVEIILDFK